MTLQDIITASYSHVIQPLAFLEDNNVSIKNFNAWMKFGSKLLNVMNELHQSLIKCKPQYVNLLGELSLSVSVKAFGSKHLDCHILTAKHTLEPMFIGGKKNEKERDILSQQNH